MSHLPSPLRALRLTRNQPAPFSRLLRHRQAVVSCALALGATALAPTIASAAPVSALPASGFRDSVGIQMHHTFQGYASDQTSTDTLARMLNDLGIWNVRDSVCLNTEAACVKPRVRMGILRAKTTRLGLPPIGYLLGITREVETHPERAVRDADIERALQAMITPPLAGSIAGIEQTNEPDLQSYRGWEQITIADDQVIRAKLAEPRFAALRGLPLLTPSMGHPENTGRLLSAGWTTAPGMTPNFHPYPPAWGGPEEALKAPCLSKANVFDCMRRLAPGTRAPWATESGYSTTGDRSSVMWVSRGAQAIYLPRLLLDNYAKGIARTYIYELNDLSPEISSATNGFGLYESKYLDPWSIVAGRAKPAAYAVARLNSRIGEQGTKIAPGGGLDFDLLDPTGKAIPDSELRRVLLRRNDGTMALALWRPEPVWSNAQFKQRTLTVDDVPVRVKLNTGIAGGWSATAFRPSIDETAVKSTGVQSFTVPVGADVTLIDLRGARYSVPVPGGPVNLDD
ncbi:MAG: hypothetical protein JHD16_13185 [Solirubrobacteraceae bacterium]|nr:hypothetical protein [Solirubrobacteraceae bacterium]